MSNLLFLAAFQFRLDRVSGADTDPCFGRDPGRAAAPGGSPRPLCALPRHGGSGVRVVAVATPAQSTHRWLDHGRCRLRVGRWGRRGRPCPGRPHVDTHLQKCHRRRSGADRGAVATLLQVVWRAIWQFRDAILLAAWLLGIGWLLRPDHLRPSRLSLLLAAAAAAGAATNVAGLNLIRDVLLGVPSCHGPRGRISLLVVFAPPITDSLHPFPVMTGGTPSFPSRPVRCSWFLRLPWGNASFFA
jgi:hypothetical protein